MAAKVLIIGAAGMLGQALMNAFRDEQPTGWDKTQLDITSQQEVEKKILDLRPEMIINAAAYTDVDGSESKAQLALQVNGEAVGYLAQAAKKIKAILVHYSTDYVFSGNNLSGYEEDAVPEPLNIYGQSKLLGEQLLQANTDKFYLIRTSWLYGSGGKNFVNNILTLAVKQPSLKVVDDQRGKPTFSLDLASATRELVFSQKPFGIYHLANETLAGGITWYEFAKTALELKGLKTPIAPCKTSEFPRPAKRPQYSVLINTKFKLLRNWQEALAEFLK